MKAPFLTLTNIISGTLCLFKKPSTVNGLKLDTSNVISAVIQVPDFPRGKPFLFSWEISENCQCSLWKDSRGHFWPSTWTCPGWKTRDCLSLVHPPLGLLLPSCGPRGAATLTKCTSGGFSRAPLEKVQRKHRKCYLPAEMGWTLTKSLERIV